MDIFPSLAPRDSYALWYTSSHNANTATQQHIESPSNAFDHLATNTPAGQNIGPHVHRRAHQLALHRTPLARLRLDEEYLERRKENIRNYGSSWIKPPGIPKSLYQLQEEKREMEEHQEALRREALAQELAEAEAADELLQGEGMDGDIDDGEVRDLDDEVPEAEPTALDADDEDPEDEENEVDVEEVPRGVLASRMPDDVYREALVRGEEVRTARFGDGAGTAIDEEDQSQMLQEEDLVHETRGVHQNMGDNMDLDMDADLDAEIPEAETGGYEHTDTEAELSSSDDDDSLDMQGPVTTSMVRSDGTQSSMDLGSIMSRDASSYIGSSSPRQRSSLRGHRGGQ